MENVIGVAMIILNIIGVVWLGIKLGHPVLISIGYIIALVIIGKINEMACIIVALVVAASPLIVIMIPVIKTIIDNIIDAVQENGTNKKQAQKNKIDSDLLDAVNRSDKQAVQSLIEYGANIYHENGAILLESAIRNCDKEMITFLLDKGVDVNFVHSGKVPLDCTADEEIIALLKSRGAKTKSEIDAAKAEREREAREKREAIKKEEEERQAREEAARKERCKLIYACEHGSLNEAKRLIQSGFDLEVRNEKGQTALMIVVRSAVANGFSEIKDAIRENNDIAKLLIQSGAKIDAKDNKGLTALMHSAMMFFEHAPLLLENGADVNAKNNKGVTVLMHACLNSFKNASIVEFLISEGANVNAKEDSNNETALMFATTVGNIEAVSALIRNGADVNAKARNGATALSAAISKGYTEIKNILINNGAYR